MAEARTFAGTMTVEAMMQTLADAAHKGTVFAPIERHGEVELASLTDQTAPTIDYTQTRLSAKAVHFPQTETLYTFDFDTVEDVPTVETDYLVFGTRPCDAQAIAMLDRIFGPENHGYHDPYYEERRERTTIISLACTQPCASCFCTSVGGGPAETAGSDVLAHHVDDALVLEPVTERGRSFIDSVSMRETSENERQAVEGQIEAATSKINEVPIDLESVKSKMDDGFEESRWVDITNSCIGCGACTYLCPTCHCFDIADEERHYKGKRIRTWDSCQYPSFTKHASGHNPRPEKTQRLRQRFMHKFSYTVESTGDVYCVGCGRCVQYCPVNIDIREVIREFSAS